MKAGWSSWPIIFTLAQLMECPACLVCSDTADLRSRACTDFPCSFSLKCLVSLLFHQCPQHHNPYVWYCKWPHISLQLSFSIDEKIPRKILFYYPNCTSFHLILSKKVSDYKKESLASKYPAKKGRIKEREGMKNGNSRGPNFDLCAYLNFGS